MLLCEDRAGASQGQCSRRYCARREPAALPVIAELGDQVLGGSAELGRRRERQRRRSRAPALWSR